MNTAVIIALNNFYLAKHPTVYKHHMCVVFVCRHLWAAEVQPVPGWCSDRRGSWPGYGAGHVGYQVWHRHWGHGGGKYGGLFLVLEVMLGMEASSMYLKTRSEYKYDSKCQKEYLERKYV